MRHGLAALGAALLAAGAWLCPAVAAEGVRPKGPLNTLADVSRALRACWQWPPLSEARSGMAFTVRLSFKRNGEIFGARITYQTRGVSEEERSLYYGALLAALARCSPLPLSPSLGAAIAGRPMNFHIHDTRQQRKA
jgi:hypothetical protein